MVAQDKIEREIVINAPVERVWDLVSEPGWWIGDGDRSAQRRWKEGDLDVIEDPKYGRFPLRTVEKIPPRYISFRWVADPAEEHGTTDGTTLVEFWVREHAGGAIVRVVESGFAALPDGEQALKDNTEGWAFQMNELKSSAESVTA